MTVVSFVVPVRNDAERLGRCLRSIAANGYPGDAVEVVVADNGSTDDSAAVAREAGAALLSLPNLRLGALRNRAAAAARGTVLAFVDADHEIGPDWVAATVEVLADGAVAAVGAACRPPASSTWVQRLYDRLRQHAAQPRAVEWLGSGNMAVRRAAFEAVGGFDEALETCEDVDLCRKLRANGGRLVADGRLENTHYGDPRTLRHLFLGELWRGRDNIRVSLRKPRSWRTIASATIPAITLTAIAATVVGAIAASALGPSVVVDGILAIALIIAVRTARMLRGASPRDLPAAFAVAGAYEIGRALAIAARAGHAWRRVGTTS